MLDRKRKLYMIIVLCFYPLALYITIKAAPYITDAGPEYLINGLTYEVLSRPFYFPLGWWTLKAVAIMTLFYALVMLLIYTEIKNYRDGEEYGSSRWATPREINKMLAAREDMFDGIPMWRQNMIMTKNVRIGYDSWRDEHQRNANTIVWGGPGTNKSRGFIMPNIMQMNGSFVVTDPKGEIAKKLGRMLKFFGYRVVVFDISNPHKSVCYNPFVYFRNDKDVLQFVNNFFAATADKKAMKGEQIWEDGAKNLMLAFAYLLYHEAPAEEQNLPMITELLKAAQVSEDGIPSAVDMIFKELETKSPEHPAVGYYKLYHRGAAKTLQSFQSTLSTKLAYFTLETVARLTSTDDIDINSIATRKTAVFCVTPEGDSSFNFLVGTLYQQMFQQLYDLADNVYDGPLPMHIRFLLDEFSKVALPDDYENILSTSRSRNISFAIVLQDMSQIEALYETIYKSMFACCSICLFLGSNERETLKYISELIGTETIIVKELSKSQQGWSTSFRPAERAMMKPEEVRRKSRKKAILIIEGEHVVLDDKFNLKDHKYYKYVADGKNLKRKKEPAEIYDWGETSLCVAQANQLKEYNGKLSDVSNLNVKVGTVMSDEELIRKYAA